ncbi:MAG: type II toxin-antitoxin system Phd/YefM family antitoxin [Beijerinckiaceae bacterium]
MVTVSLAQAKAQLSELLNKVQAGEEIVITRRGRPIAHLVPISSPKQKLRSLADFRAKMPSWRQPSSLLLRDARNEDL